MSSLSSAEFIDLVRRSNLVAKERLDSWVQSHADEMRQPAESVAGALVAEELLTRWQTQKLLNRRYKGFFLGKYKLLDQIGSGGMSRVYLAEHTMLRQLRAIKVLPRERVADSSYLARFHLEAQATASLDHTNIVRAYDIDHVGDIHFLVMEFVPGKDLQTLVAEEGPLEYTRAARYMAQAAHGLAHAHQVKLIHRDVKPGNLLIDPRDNVKLLDLGLALFSESDTSLTIAHAENVLGTADYLAPEQAVNSHEVDGRADIYGLGCTLYFALTGAPPFPEGTLAQRIAQHQSVMPPSLKQHRADCPDDLEKICFRMMEKDPAKRYQTAAEVADVLEKWIEDYETRPREHAAQLVAAGTPAAKDGATVDEEKRRRGLEQLRSITQISKRDSGKLRSSGKSSGKRTERAVKSDKPASQTAPKSAEGRSSIVLPTPSPSPHKLSNGKPAATGSKNSGVSQKGMAGKGPEKLPSKPQRPSKDAFRDTATGKDNETLKGLADLPKLGQPKSSKADSAVRKAPRRSRRTPVVLALTCVVLAITLSTIYYLTHR